MSHLARRCLWLASHRPETLGDALAAVFVLEAARSRLSRSQWRRVRWAGLGVIEQARSRVTGTVTSIVPAADFEGDAAVGRYGLICEDHAGCVVVETLQTARALRADPREWCPTCQGDD